MTTRLKRSSTVAALVAALALAACGGDDDTPAPGGGGGGPPASTLISGTAAAGAPIIGKVTVRDSAGTQKTVDIAADGTYTVDVTGLVAPFQFRAVGSVGGRDIALSSAATAADVGNTINITPFTDLIVANVAGRAVDSFLAAGDFAKLTTADLNAARDTLTQRLLPVLRELGVADSFDLLRTAFAADRTKFDAVMDVVRVSVDPATNQAVIRDLVNNQQIQDDLASKADSTPIPAPAAGSLTGAVTDLQQIDAVFAAINELFKNVQPASDNVALRALLSPDFLDYGVGLEEFLSPEYMPEAGGKLRNAVIQRRADNGDLLVGFEYVGPGGDVDRGEWFFRKDDAGKWRAAGNQLPADVSLSPVNHRSFFGGTVSFSRHLELWIDSAVNGVQSATLTGPGLSGGAVTYRRSTGSAATNFNLVDGAGLDLHTSWIPECVTAGQAPCIAFTNVGVDTAYTLTLRDQAGAAVGAPIVLTLQRPPVSNADAQANASKWFASFTVSPASFRQLAEGSNITVQWTPPSEAGYRVDHIGLTSGDIAFNGDPSATATSFVLGTWSGAAPLNAPGMWVHVEGPYGRLYVTGQPYPQ